MQQPDALQAQRILVVQLALSLVLSVAALPFSLSVALSVLIGGAVCLVANSVFAFWVFRKYRARETGPLMMRFYGAEVVKLALVVGLFGLIFAKADGLNPPALLIAYFAVQVLPAVFASGSGARPTPER